MAQRKTTRKSTGRGGRKTPAKKKFTARGKGSRKGGRSRRKKSRTFRLWQNVADTCTGLGEHIANGVTALHNRIWHPNGENEAEQNPLSPKKRASGTATKKTKRKTGKEHHHMDDEDIKTENAAADTPGDPDGLDEEISWNQQLSSIIIGVLALLMLALIVFKGDNLWTVIHNFIFGMFGNMAILWNALLVYSGYMFAKQKGEMRILEITRGAAGIIIFIDVLTYILIQSNGYRNMSGELTYGYLAMAGQIYDDGAKLGGTGLLGGLIGEILLHLLGKAGGAIVCGLVLFGLAMLISHTTPVALIENIRRTIRHGWLVTTALFREEIPRTVMAVLKGEDLDEEHLSFDDEEGYDEDGDGNAYADDPAYPSKPDDIFVFTDEPDSGDDVPAAMADDSSDEQTADELKKSLAEMDVGDIINKVAQIKEQKKKKKKKTRAEEIEEQKEAFAQQVDAAQTEAQQDTDTQENQEETYQYPTVRLLIASKNTGEADSLE